MNLFENPFKRKETLTRYVQVPTLYPMGAYTFAIACSHCKNKGSDKCHDCKCEKKSGFELDLVTVRKEETTNE